MSTSRRQTLSRYGVSYPPDDPPQYVDAPFSQDAATHWARKHRPAWLMLHDGHGVIACELRDGQLHKVAQMDVWYVPPGAHEDCPATLLSDGLPDECEYEPGDS